MSSSYFHKISFHYFEDYLMTKLKLGQGNPNANQGADHNYQEGKAKKRPYNRHPPDSIQHNQSTYRDGHALQRTRDAKRL